MTNETIQTIRSRRSCRAYKPEQITNEELEAVLGAGTYAASAMGKQSAKIVVVQDAATREKLSAASLGLGSCWINRAKEEFESEEGKALLKKWGIEGEWIGVGHCILGYPAGDPQPAAPRKSDYILKV